MTTSPNTFITTGLPADVLEAYFSGKYWYAATKEKVLNKPKACGSGNTLDEAIADMRDLASRYVPYERRASYKASESLCAESTTRPAGRQGLDERLPDRLKMKQQPLSPSHPKALEAEVRGSQWLAKGNEYYEAGKLKQAEKCYDKSQYWLDRYNKLTGRD